MVISNTLSQNPAFDDKSGDTLTVMLPDHLFLCVIDTDLRQEITKSNEIDPLVKEAIEALKNEGPSDLKLDLADWKTDEGLVLYKGKVYIPADEKLR
ncbi:hypothetical protein QCA50_011959 [Cerrena zonata]|uniref:Uncharacterized protein n=1 Tax=Cerrena zonata TaxID=2478898 RepID=A0AAW0G400_9APHY